MTPLRLKTISEKINPHPRQKRYSEEEKRKHLLFLLQRSMHFPNENLTSYAQRHRVSRQFLYALQEKTHQIFLPQKSGPKEKLNSPQNPQKFPKPGTSPLPVANEPSSLSDSSQTFLKKQPSICPEILEILASIPHKLGIIKLLCFLRTFLTLVTSPISSSNTKESLEEAFEVKLSNTQFCSLSQFFSKRAASLLEPVDAELNPKKVALDEVYSGEHPILMGVELKSNAVFLAKQEERCTGKEWKSALKPYEFEEVVSDEGGALRKGLRREKKIHQFDVAHLKKNLKKQLKRREAYAYEKIKKEYQAQKKAQKNADKRKLYLKIQKEVREHLSHYDEDERDLKRILEGLEIFDQEGELKDLGKNLEEMKWACERLKKSKNKWARYYGRLYLGEKAFRFQRILWKGLKKIKLRWRYNTQKEEDLEVLKVISFRQFEERDLKNRWKRRFREKRERLEARRGELKAVMEWKKEVIKEEREKLQWKLKNFSEVEKEVEEVFKEMLRASSVIEGINSRIRLLQQTRKKLGQSFLDLWRWKHNNSRFEEGKRRGKSPYEEAGVKESGFDWKSALIFG